MAKSNSVNIKSIGNGQKIRIDTMPEREKAVAGISNKEAVMGGSVGGGTRSLAHSFSGNTVKKI